MEKYIYEFDVYGLYLGKKIAKVNPRNPNKILVPTSATNLKLPQYSPEHEVLIFNTNIPGIGDTSVVECSWTILNKKNLILDTELQRYRHMTIEEQEEKKYEDTVRDLREKGIEVFGRIQKLTTFEPRYKYLDMNTNNVYTFDSGTVTGYNNDFPNKCFDNINGDKSLIVIFREENGIVYEVVTFAYNKETFEKYFYSNIELLYPDFDENIHKVYLTTTEEYIQIKSTPVFKKGILREATKEEQIEMKIIPPNDEPIWVKKDNEWIISQAKLLERGQEILQKLYQLRTSKHNYFNFTVNGNTYKQRWTDADKIYMELIIRDLNSGKFQTVNWRFNGADPDAVEALNLEDVYRMFNTGKIQELRLTCAQLLAAAKIKGFILSNNTTLGVDYLSEFDNQLSTLNDIPDETIEAYYNSL